MGRCSHACLLMLLGISYDILNILFYFSVPNKGKELPIFDIQNGKTNCHIPTPTNCKIWQFLLTDYWLLHTAVPEQEYF